MARISFTAIVAAINGKLAGSVFQYSYGGYQLHTRVSPRNPQTQYQQLRRMNFGFLAASWRSLTSIERQTWIDAAVTEPQAFDLFISSNINLILIGEPTVNSYVPTSVPDEIALDITELTPASFQVMATGPITVVPADTALLFFSTFQKYPTKIFTNPSEYSPIQAFPAGTDLSTPTEVLPAFNARYGQLVADKRLCIKTALIDITNGNRGAEPSSCANSEEVAKFVKIFTEVTQPTSIGTGGTSVATFNIPANTFLTDGDIVTIRYAGTQGGGGAGNTLNTFVAGSGIGWTALPVGNTWQVHLVLQRIDSTNLKVSAVKVVGSGVVEQITTQRGPVDFTTTIATDLVLTAPVAGFIQLTMCDINKELQ